MNDPRGVPAYYWRHQVPYVAWFCTQTGAREFLDGGEQAETLCRDPAPADPRVEYRDEGHYHCWDENCPEFCLEDECPEADDE